VGQNGVQQAKEFTQVAGVTGIVLTKLDGTAKGGVAVAIANDLKLPIRYVGVGEGIDDLIPFSAQEYVDALFQEKWCRSPPPIPTRSGCSERWSRRVVGSVAPRQTRWSAPAMSPMKEWWLGTGRTSEPATRTRKSTRSTKRANTRAERRSIAPSNRVAIRGVPGHARSESLRQASAASSQRWRIRSRW
jgi:hypothetical protein